VTVATVVEITRNIIGTGVKLRPVTSAGETYASLTSTWVLMPPRALWPLLSLKPPATISSASESSAPCAGNGLSVANLLRRSWISPRLRPERAHVQRGLGRREHRREPGELGLGF